MAKYLFSYLYLLERNLEGKWFVVIWIKSAFFDRRFLLLQSFAILHQRDFNVRIWKTADVHFLQIFSFQNDHRKLASRWYVSQWKAYVSQFVILYSLKESFFNIFSISNTSKTLTSTIFMYIIYIYVQYIQDVRKLSNILSLTLFCGTF